MSGCLPSCAHSDEALGRPLLRFTGIERCIRKGRDDLVDMATVAALVFVDGHGGIVEGVASAAALAFPGTLTDFTGNVSRRLTCCKCADERIDVAARRHRTGLRIGSVILHTVKIKTVVRSVIGSHYVVPRTG